MLFLQLHLLCVLLYSFMLLLSQVALHKRIVVGNYGGFIRTTAGQHNRLSMQTQHALEELLLFFMIAIVVHGQMGTGGVQDWLGKWVSQAGGGKCT